MKNAQEILENRAKQAQKKKRAAAEWEPDQVEIPEEMPKLRPLDTAPGCFAGGLEKNFGGINTAKSVFDRTAVFHVSRETKK